MEQVMLKVGVATIEPKEGYLRARQHHTRCFICCIELYSWNHTCMNNEINAIKKKQWKNDWNKQPNWTNWYMWFFTIVYLIFSLCISRHSNFAFERKYKILHSILNKKFTLTSVVSLLFVKSYSICKTSAPHWKLRSTLLGVESCKPASDSCLRRIWTMSIWNKD